MLQDSVCTPGIQCLRCLVESTQATLGWRWRLCGRGSRDPSSAHICTDLLLTSEGLRTLSIPCTIETSLPSCDMSSTMTNIHEHAADPRHQTTTMSREHASLGNSVRTSPQLSTQPPSPIKSEKAERTITVVKVVITWRCIVHPSSRPSHESIVQPNPMMTLAPTHPSTYHLSNSTLAQPKSRHVCRRNVPHAYAKK